MILEDLCNSVPRYMGKSCQIQKTQRTQRNTQRKKVCTYEFQSGIAKFVNPLFRKASMGFYRVLPHIPCIPLGIKRRQAWEFPGGLVVWILGFHCHGLGSIPGWGAEGTEMPQAMQHGQNKQTEIGGLLKY